MKHSYFTLKTNIHCNRIKYFFSLDIPLDYSLYKGISEYNSILEKKTKKKQKPHIRETCTTIRVLISMK